METTDKVAPIAPTVHINGDSKEGLLEGYLKTLRALAKAKEALADISPHPRNFYVQKDPNAFTKARDEHQRRLRALDDITREIMAIAEQVQEQGR